MKNILLVTDFSQNAQRATLHAAGLARHAAARLIIFHALAPVSAAEDESEAAVSEPEEEAQARLDMLAAELHEMFGISITRLLKPGIAGQEILALTQKTAADLLVMGARGAGLLHQRPMGSLAAEMLVKSHIPLVCFPTEPLASLPDELSLILQKKPDFCNPQGIMLLQQIAQQISSPKPVAD